MAEVFISYARSTAASAQAIARALEADGFSVWIDDELPAHRDFPTVIEENLHAAKAVLVLWSADAVASRWVPAEADVAHKAGTLVQLSLDGASPPLPFNRMQCVKLPDWNNDFGAPAWLKVASSIEELVRPRHAPRTATPAAPSPASVVRTRAVTNLLAVLPFDNISSDPELAYFSDGVSEEIQQTVAQGSDLRVVARSSSFQFRGADKAVRNVAAELNATHLLDGSVRRSGERVRITAQLVECVGETTLWSNRFDGDLNDVFDLQDRIAAAVAQALKVTLSPAPQGSPMDPAAYEQFLKARGVLTEGSRLDAAALEATPLLEAVTVAAPAYAPAWDLLANSRAWALRSGLRHGEYAEGRAGVETAAETALRLDPRRGGAYVALALLEPWGAYAAREKLLRLALQAGPNEPGALTELSTFCWSVGRFREALRYAEQACELNPLMPAARLNFAQMRAYVGDYDSSIRMHQEIHRRWPRNLPILASLLNFSASLGFTQAYEEARGVVGGFEGWEASHLQRAVDFAETALSGDEARRRALLDHYEARLSRTGTLPLNYIEAISELGLVNEALDLAQRASFDHVFDPDGPLPSGAYPGTVLGPWSALNKAPRFVELCDRLGLCEYWIQSDAWPDCVAWAPYDFKAEVRRVAGGPAARG